LRWNHEYIWGDNRNWIKKYNMIGYKADILISTHFEDILINNVIQEIDWEKTCNFIKKGEKDNYFYTSGKDNMFRSYKIKNLIKELPTYEILYERNIKGIKYPYCVRCYNNITQTYEVENWDHIWCCCENETTEIEII
jgi:hypothetical protein